MLILIGLVIEGSIQVRSVHGAPNQWIVKYATSVKTPSDFLQEEGEFSFTVPADSPYANLKAFKSTAIGKVIYNLKTVYPPIEHPYQCTGKYNSQYTSSVSVAVIYNLPVQGIDSTPILHLYGISGTEPESVFYTWNCVTDDGSRTWQIKDEAYLPIVSLCRGSNVIEIPLKDGSTYKDDSPDVKDGSTYKCEITIHGTANQKPVANAGPDQEVNAEDVVTLDGTGSSDPDGDPITYSWRQIGGGTTVQLSNPQSPNPTFTAPSPAAPSETDGTTPFRPASFVMNKGLTFVSAESEVIRLIFQLTVNDGTLSSLPSNVVITVNPCTTEEQKKADEIDQIVTRIINYELAKGYPEAGKRFQHWREGSGTPMPLELKWLEKSDDFKGAMARLRLLYETNFSNQGAGKSIYKTALSMKDGKTERFPDDWKSAITFPNPLTDFGAAVGRTQIVSDGMFTMTRQGNYFLVKGTVNLQLEDRFDFNLSGNLLGKRFPIPVYPFNISADDLNLLEKCKGAKPFIQAIKWKQEVSGRATLYQMHELRPLQWNTIP